jgi:hypothetical protein
VGVVGRLGVAITRRAVRDAFRFLFNAQFFGADVASLLPRELAVGSFVGTLVAILVFVWVFGDAWAWLYKT